jgi:transcription-repair coupling factor (superfamily II helicase)
VTEALRRAGEFPQIHLARFGAAATTGEDIFDFPVSSVSRFEGEAAAVVGELCRAAETKEVHVFCDAEGEKQRLLEMIGEQGGTAPGRLQVHSGVMHHGFEWKGTSTVVLPHHELFQRHRQRRRIRRIHAGRPLESWLDLKPGDQIVHVVHGIAIYRGLTRLAKGSRRSFSRWSLRKGLWFTFRVRRSSWFRNTSGQVRGGRSFPPWAASAGRK